MKTKFLCGEFEFGGTIGDLCAEKGKYKGVYIIVLPDNFKEGVRFKDIGNAGRFKGRNPTVPIEKLQKKWVAGAEILYIGKSEQSVLKRMQQHKDFWEGRAVPAWGGRIVAQIHSFENFEVWYMPCDDPQKTESELLETFKTQYNKLPFANFRR